VTNIVPDELDMCLWGKRLTAVSKAWQRERFVEGVSFLNYFFFDMDMSYGRWVSKI
jgi:hypothetical protein